MLKKSRSSYLSLKGTKWQIQPATTHQNPPPANRDAALRIYSLAQKYGLHREALQATQAISECPMGIEGS
jgi:hypothetical protein